MFCIYLKTTVLVFLNCFVEFNKSKFVTSDRPKKYSERKNLK